tara:strand:- start:19472 stop:20737 length:1266 start_codon:yes stop_codon:yes gene_type:complete
MTHKIGIIGLGYVGFPLAFEFSKRFEVIGFDLSKKRIKELKDGYDKTNEISQKDLKLIKKNIVLTDDINKLKTCNIYIITVPTPVDKNNSPDMSFLKKASQSIGNLIKSEDIVIYESTVYPGATEEICVPILEEASNLVFNKDFFVGYSPERINPGDKNHTLTNIKKIVSASSKESLEKIYFIYSEIIKAGVYKAESIKVAEAAKVIENTQRDINIALMNELAKIFDKLEIDTKEVLDAASTKWNFLPFKPGLVGGHCIGVDPYYLSHKAQEVGLNPEIVLSGRRINESMVSFVAGSVEKLMKNKSLSLSGSNILIMGLTFKENCPDIRNSKVFDLIKAFEKKGANVEIFDPVLNKDNFDLVEIELLKNTKKDFYDAIIFCVKHKELIEIGIENIKSMGKKVSVIFDITSSFPKFSVDGRL